ncbi:diguanylate cyclase [Thalassotalea piscium]
MKDSNSREAYLYLQKHLQEAENLSIENRLVFYKFLAETYSEQALYHKSKAITDKALLLAKKLNSPSIVSAELYYTRGFAVESLGAFDQAIINYKNGLEIAESLSDQKNIATGLINLGAIYYLTQKFDRALIVFNQALNIAIPLKDNELLGYIYSELGILYGYMFEEDKAMQFYQKSYEYFQKAGKSFYAYNSLRNIAINHSQHERYDDVIKLNKEIVEHADEIGNIEIITSAYSGLAWSYLKKKDNNPELAYEYMNIAEQYVSQSEQHQLPLTFGISKAFFLYEMEKYDESLEKLLSIEPLLHDKNTVVNNNSRLNVLYLKADILYKKKSFKEAYQSQNDYLELAFKIRDSSNYEAVEDLRMRYESEQADLQKQILDQQTSLQTIRIKDSQYQEGNRNILLVFSAIIVLVISWFLFKVIRGQRKFTTISQTDALTGIVNRRRLIELSDFFFYQAKQTQKMFSVLMIDIDDFKLVNDNYGHKIGDKVLQVVSEIGSKAMRSTDVFGRFGGEEFIVLLPETDLDQAQVIAERLCKNINDYPWENILGSNVTVSIGVACIDLNVHYHADDLIKSADILMYKAKSQGKNQVCC